MTARRIPALLAGTAAGLLVTLTWSASASAAAQVPCAPATMLPNAKSIPANLPAFGYTALKATANDVHLTLDSSGSPTPVPVTVGPVADGYLKVVPTSPLTVGASYELAFDAFCTYGAHPPQGPMQFTVTAAAPLPTKVGAVAGTPTFEVKDFGTTRYQISAKYTVDPEMKPWASVYTLGVLFDGKPIETKAALSAAGDTVQVDATGWCDATTAQKNQHELVLRARLPFATTVQTSATTLDFACPAPNHVTPTPASIPTGTNPAPTGDGGANKASTTTTTTEGGCAVSSGAGGARGARAGATMDVALLALAMGGLARRRRGGRDSASSSSSKKGGV